MMDWARVCKLLFWTAVLGAYGAAISPNGGPSIAQSDKVNHIIAFFTLALFVRPAYPQLSSITLGLLLAGFGGLIEITQMIPALHRDASWLDWIADVAAIFAGLGIANLLMLALRSRSA